ncbi:MAG: hypothetical protein KJN92_09775, partial [Gemmatimonadetes bacterium]|nr:hypothetical protein [Gemmatimonadota bacterium]
GWDQQDADLRILCMHHCVEGATVGPGNFTFRHAPDVIRCADLPVGFAAVLSGHIHRHQRLRQDLQGRPLPTPVLYPGSVERTAFAEMGEEKGFILMEAEPGADGGALENHVFKRLPSRPMIVRELRPRGGSEARWTPGDLEGQVRTVLSQVPVDAVLRLRIQGHVPPYLRPLLSAGNLRRLAPAEMNLEVVIVEDQDHRRAIRSMKESRKAPGSAPLESQIQRSVL